MFGQAVKEVAAVQGLTHEQLGLLANDERSTVSKRLTGKRPVTRHFVKRIADELDSSKVYLEGIGDLFGGAFYLPVLDGDEVDLSIRGIDEKLEEEIAEIYALGSSKPRGKKDAAVYKDKELAQKEVAETIDCIHCLVNRVARICDLSGISIKDSFKEHTKKLQVKGYIKKAPAFADAGSL